MLQQINLYKLLPTKSRFQLTPRLATAIYGVFLLFLIFIYGLEVQQKHRVMAQYTLLNNQVNVLQQHLASLTQQYPISDAAALNKTVEELQHQLSMKVKMLNLLTSKNNFTVYLSALANIDMSGIWLTEIELNNVSQKINLKGFALKSELVDNVLIKLDAQPAFAMLKFEVQNVTENPLPLSFEISAKPEVLL